MKKFMGAGKVGFQPGKKRKHGGGFLRQHHGRIVVKGAREKDKTARFAVSSKGFMEQHREHRVIEYKGAGYGLGRGHGHHASGYHLSAATKLKISEALRGKKHPHKGHSESAKTRELISASLKKYAASHPAAIRARNIKAGATRKLNDAKRRSRGVK